MTALRIPGATCRLQLSGRFGFNDARKLVPYLARLGISDVYASPIFQARAGSTHGYDVTDPAHLNPELGAEKEFSSLVRELKLCDMGLLLDIVPNHMAAVTGNPWWADLLENGLYSPYAAFFDIDWGAGGGRIMLPVLDTPYETALANREFKLELAENGLYISYHELKLPLDIRSCGMVLSGGAARLEDVIAAASKLPFPAAIGPGESDKIYRERQTVKKTFLAAVNSSGEIRARVQHSVALFNAGNNGPDGFKKLLDKQAWRLIPWRAKDEYPNYRRFFDINDLAGLRVENPEVFAAAHALVFRLVQEGSVTGLRVDHVDGLADPAQYLARLRQHVPGGYITVEKILMDGESLSAEWPVSGTTGYDFLNMLNSFLVDEKGIGSLYRTYSGFTGIEPVFGDIAYEKKRQVMRELLPGEMKSLSAQLATICCNLRPPLKILPDELNEAFAGITASLSVYRPYIGTSGESPLDRLYLDQAVAAAKERHPVTDNSAFDAVHRVLKPGFPDSLSPERVETRRRFVARWQQLCAAVMAKGVEDTALYNYSCLLSLNEVGGNPASGGLFPEGFHDFNSMRLKQTPHTLNATSTHDTKRSEDVRARISVLSEIPDEWAEHLERWRRWNREKKRVVNGIPVPEPETESLLYQTLLGAWPFSEGEIPEFKERLTGYMIKAAREAKAFTRWLDPDPAYESSLTGFLESILDISVKNGFLNDFLKFTKRVSFYGALNSLSQVLLKITAPGVPDFYQGTELWDLSLVDPDNRRPVDFKKRQRLLSGIIRQEAHDQAGLIRRLLKRWPDGRIKLYIIYKALNARRNCRSIFLDGQYIPLEISGRQREHAVAFARRKGERWVIAVAPRHLAGLVDGGVMPLGRSIWEETAILLPPEAPQHWCDMLAGTEIKASGNFGQLHLADILSSLPVALLRGV